MDKDHDVSNKNNAEIVKALLAASKKPSTQAKLSSSELAKAIVASNRQQEDIKKLYHDTVLARALASSDTIDHFKEFNKGLKKLQEAQSPWIEAAKKLNDSPFIEATRQASKAIEAAQSPWIEAAKKLNESPLMEATRQASKALEAAQSPWMKMALENQETLKALQSYKRPSGFELLKTPSKDLPKPSRNQLPPYISEAYKNTKQIVSAIQDWKVSNEKATAESHSLDKEMNELLKEQKEILSDITEQNLLVIKALTELLNHNVKTEEVRAIQSNKQEKLTQYSFFAALLGTVIAIVALLNDVFWTKEPKIVVNPIVTIQNSKTTPDLGPIFKDFEWTKPDPSKK